MMIFRLIYSFRSRSVSKSTSLATGNVNEAFKDSSEADSCIDGKDHMCQALISDDGVVLDLEDCCNMTICDKVSEKTSIS